jgi:hypothetical protein
MRFSLLPHIMSLVAPSGKDSNVGEIIENARVIRLDSGVGALLALPNEEENDDEDDSSKKGNILQTNPIYQSASKVRCAYVHISKAIDNDKNRTPEALFAKKFALNTKIPKLRIISCGNWMDNVASCATAESIVSSAVLTHTDLQPGMIYKSVPVIANLDNGGVLVQLGVGVKGLIPALHLFDKSMPTDNGNNSYRSKVRMEKYKVGNKINVRCLMISPSERKCVLTAKKGLISSDNEDPITEYPTIENGRTATGFISRVSKQGIAITFYNNVFGRISARKLAEEMGVSDPNVDYKIGDVITVKVSQCFKKTARDAEEEDEDHQDSYILNLSLNLLSEDNESPTKDGNSAKLIGLLEPGMILKAKSMKIVELVPSKEREGNSFLPGHAIVSIKSKHICKEEDSESSIKGSVTCKLPYEHILDSHDAETIQSPQSMDALASKVLAVGKKIAQEAVVLTVTSRNGSASTPIVSLKPTVVATAKDNLGTESPFELLPKPSTALFMGAYVRGYCVRLHQKYGAFIRFLGGLTAIVPKLKGGLDIGLYDTVLCKVVAMDVMSGKAPKILLKQVDPNHTKKSKSRKKEEVTTIIDTIKPGDRIGDIKIDDINFARAAVSLLDTKFLNARVKARVHMTMAKPIKGGCLKMPIAVEEEADSATENEIKEKITKYHPFSTWKIGEVIKDVKCAAVDVRDGVTYVEVTNRDDDERQDPGDSPPLFVEDPSRLTAGSTVLAVITSVAKQNKGLWVQICPGISGFIPGLELSNDIQVLNNLSSYFKIGGRVTCCVVDDNSDKGLFKKGVRLSVLGMGKKSDKKNNSRKPICGDLLIGRVNRFIKQQRAPALMIQLPGGYLGRCDITELEEVDDWENMPLGRLSIEGSSKKEKEEKEKEENPPDVSTEDDFENEEDEESRYDFNIFAFSLIALLELLRALLAMPRL